MAIVLTLPDDLDARINQLLMRRKLEAPKIDLTLTPPEEREAMSIANKKGAAAANIYVAGKNREKKEAARLSHRPSKYRLVEELLRAGLEALGA